MTHAEEDPNANDEGFVDPHASGACCHACGFAAELEKSGVPPPAPGARLVFPLDDAGVPRGAAVIVRRKGAERDAEVHDVTKAEVIVGRVQGVDVVLPSGNISKRQMRLVFRGDGVVVEDTRSGCGTYVNGKHIRAQALCDGDKIYAGDYTLELIRIPT